MSFIRSVLGVWCRVVGHHWCPNDIAIGVLSLTFLGMFKTPDRICRRCGAKHPDNNN